ncbi:MAG: HTH domain-containing protein [Streptosporangiaceae bacterium]
MSAEIAILRLCARAWLVPLLRLLLQKRGRMTVMGLGDGLEVSVRTIYWDVEALKAGGVLLYGGAGAPRRLSAARRASHRADRPHRSGGADAVPVWMLPGRPPLSAWARCLLRQRLSCGRRAPQGRNRRMPESIAALVRVYEQAANTHDITQLAR